MMNRRKVVPSLLAAVAVQNVNAAEWRNQFAREWRDSFHLHWEVTRDYTLAVADAMPAEGYDSKPDPAQRTFGEQLIHLGFANALYMRAFGMKDPPATPKLTDKETARAFLTATFDYVSEVLQKIEEKALLRKDLSFSSRQKPHSGTDLFMRAYMHTAHHRGQLVVYLRVKGIVPPTWAFEPTAA
jgi:uncharacterized damage-inducible protein DinB